MGTLNISSMDLRAVNVPVRRPAQAKPKRPKFKSTPVSRTQKCVMLFSAVGLIAAAFILPPVTGDAEPVRKVASAAITEGSTPEQNVAPPQGQRLQSSDVAATKIGQMGTATRKKEMAPISDALPFAASTQSDVSIALVVLASYIQNGSAEQKQDAHLRIGVFRRELYHAALCDLIRNNESPALAVFADLVVQHKPDGGVDALIERLNSTKRMVYARDALIGALCHFAEDAKSSEEIMLLLNSKSDEDRSATWKHLGAQMPVSLVKIALDRVIQGSPDAQHAAQALGRYGSTVQQGMRLVADVEQQLMTGAQPVRVRLVEMLIGLDPNATASRLRILTSDPNEDIRAMSLKALAHDPNNTEVILMALRNDSSRRVKAACIDGLGATQNSMALSELISLLTDESLRHNAKRTLVMANNGTDLGWEEFEWRAWLEGADTQK